MAIGCRFTVEQSKRLAVAKPEWGTKRVCQSCSAKYYDLCRDPIICPKCGVTFDPETMLRSRRPRPAAAKPAKAVESEAPKADDDDIEVEEVVAADDDDEESIEDASELGEDEVIDVRVAKDDDDK